MAIGVDASAQMSVMLNVLDAKKFIKTLSIRSLVLDSGTFFEVDNAFSIRFKRKV